MKERIYNYDIMRVLAFLMVICEHSFMPSGNANGMVLGAFTYLTNPSIGLFFVISGALLLPIKLDTKSFICKRLSKVIYPTLIFTFIYLVLNIIVGKKKIFGSVFFLSLSQLKVLVSCGLCIQLQDSILLHL